jgi:HEAT repeat protein
MSMVLSQSGLFAVIVAAALGHASQPANSQGDVIVQQLRELPTPLAHSIQSNGRIVVAEERRRELYQRLRRLGDDALPALERGLGDPDVRLRKNVALALNALSGSWFDRHEAKMDIRPILPALIAALRDSEPYVRAWSAQAIGEVGPDAVAAVPALATLLASSDEGSRNSACIALHGIGAPARDTLPALRKALQDPSEDVRRFAARAIEKIQKD